MSPILGIIASQNYSRVAPDTGAMFPLGMVQVGSGGTSTITFSSIPSTYKHLQIRMSYNNLTGLDNMKMVLNGSVNSTRYHWLYADGSSAAATSNTTNLLTYQAGRSDTQQYAAIVDILEYANTSINKTIRTLGGVDNNGSGGIFFNSNLYATTAAISSIALSFTTYNFTPDSRISLYGIKGA